MTRCRACAIRSLAIRKVQDIRNYILKGNLWEAFDCDVQPVLLIDEIDKADIEFPNDLLRELDRMEFSVYETHETVRAKHRPIIVITSNNEKELPDAFLRRCFFHYIRFPGYRDHDANRRCAFSGPEARAAARGADDLLQDPRNAGPEEKADHLGTARLDQAAGHRRHSARKLCAAMTPKKLIPPLYGALLKNEQDVHLFEQLVFLHRRNAR